MKGVQCKKCRYLLKNKDGYNWCPNKLDDPDTDLIRDCEWFAVKTNADRIRSMTDEEMADRIMGYVRCDACEREFHIECNPLKTCRGIWLDWLKQEEL